VSGFIGLGPDDGADEAYELAHAPDVYEDRADVRSEKRDDARRTNVPAQQQQQPRSR
jgi:hypothetical protein